MRAVSRMSSSTDLYGGKDSTFSSRIDSFLDANLVFSREHQVYILSIENLNSYTYERMKSAYEFYLDGIELSLSNNKYIAGNKLSLADISFVCDFSQFLREGHYEESLANQGFKIISKNIKKFESLKVLLEEFMSKRDELKEFEEELQKHKDELTPGTIGES